MSISTPELTAIDLANRPEHGGALHNVATVLIDLAKEGKLGDEALTPLVDRFPAAAARRVGWMVEQFTDVRLDALAKVVANAVDEPSNLDKHAPRRGRVNTRWRLRVSCQSGARPDADAARTRRNPRLLRAVPSRRLRDRLPYEVRSPWSRRADVLTFDPAGPRVTSVRPLREATAFARAPGVVAGFSVPDRWIE